MISTRRWARNSAANWVALRAPGRAPPSRANLKASIAHHGLSVIDVISPCVTFNDHEGSTKSYAYMKEHDLPLHELDFVPAYEDISVEIPEGEVREVELHDGSRPPLKKLGRDYDPGDKLNALRTIHEADKRGEVVTGVLYLDSSRKHFMDLLNVVDEPLGTLPEARVRPPQEVLDQVMEELR